MKVIAENSSDNGKFIIQAIQGNFSLKVVIISKFYYQK